MKSSDFRLKIDPKPLISEETRKKT